MGVVLTLQNMISDNEIPSRYRFKKWVSTVLNHCYDVLAVELTIRIVDAVEIQQLNAQYRKKNKPTNVLSFPSEIPSDFLLNEQYLGDIVICASVVRAEAKEQNKQLLAHWAHLTIHGVLHLLGYDHVQDAEAVIMEKMEVDLLASLSYPNPYET